MLHILLVLNLIIQPVILRHNEDSSDDVFDRNLVKELKNDANLDLPVDEEYEDLRAEFLAYHAALASLVSGETSLVSGETSRRSMKSTPCWNLGGICINRDLCTGFRSLTQVPGCKDKLQVCCFVWNRYNVRDMREHDINLLALPWTYHKVYGGKGVQVVRPKKKKTKKKSENISDKKVKTVIVLRTDKAK